MFNSMLHAEIGGGCTLKRKICLSAADLRQPGEGFEIMALTEDGDELESIRVPDEAAAIREFNNLVQRYAGSFQRAVNAAGLVPGRKYTLVYLNDFGFPVAEKITFSSFRFSTYAQHSDVVEMFFTPYRKRKLYSYRFYNCSLMIFDGWQDMKETDIRDVLKDDDKVRVTKSKYPCFSANYIEDLENAFTKPVLIYKNYRRGANGNLYA